MFEVGGKVAASRICVVGGTVLGRADDGETWQYYQAGSGHNSIFKWSPSGGRVVIKCSIFEMEEALNGVDSMEMPPGTVVDDSECPENPSTIVWLGRGDYPAGTAGMRVVKDRMRGPTRFRPARRRTATDGRLGFAASAGGTRVTPGAKGSSGTGHIPEHPLHP